MSTPADRRALLARPVETLLVEAKRMGMPRDDVLQAVQERWTELIGDGAPRTRDERNDD